MINEKYSFKNFAAQSFKHLPASEFDNTIIKGSCFAQEIPHEEEFAIKDIFPDGMTGVTFQRCNLDNVLIPVGNIIESADGIESTNKKIQRQNDLEDWILDENDNPIEPMNKKEYIKLGISTDPKDIPETKLEEPVTINQ